MRHGPNPDPPNVKESIDSILFLKPSLRPNLSLRTWIIWLKAVEIQLTNTDTGTRDFREGSWEPFPAGACYFTVSVTSRRDHTPATVTE